MITLIFGFLLAWSLKAQTTISVTDTTGWTPWMTANNAVMVDPAADQQTGQGQDDFVGDLTYYGFQQKAGKLVSDPTNDYILYQARMAKYDNKGFGGNWELGMDLDGNGSVDLIMKMTDKNGQTITFASPGTGANTSPSTTSWGTFAGSITLNSNTYSYQNATAIDSGYASTTSTANAWVTFAISFTNLQTAIQTYATGFSTYTVDSNTRISYIAFTSTQGNAINQDLYGTAGNLNSTLTFADLGAGTGPLSPSGVVPEPATYLQLGVLMLSGLGVIWWRRRGAKGQTTAVGIGPAKKHSV